jgi:hypothetical protein
VAQAKRQVLEHIQYHGSDMADIKREGDLGDHGCPRMHITRIEDIISLHSGDPSSFLSTSRSGLES